MKACQLRENTKSKREKIRKPNKITFTATAEVVELLKEVENPSDIINEAIVIYVRK